MIADFGQSKKSGGWGTVVSGGGGALFLFTE